MSDLKFFKHPGFGTVRVVMRDGDPWFVGEDICKVLGLTNYASLDEDEKADVVILDTSSKGILQLERHVVAISESGLYTLMGRSSKPETVTFKHWIKHEVLLSIRKNERDFAKMCLLLLLTKE